jgi:uncharacterized protein DUF559
MQGWTVIRFWNSEVNENPEGVAAAILLKAAECLGGTHPQPLPSREGGKGARACADPRPSVPQFILNCGEPSRGAGQIPCSALPKPRPDAVNSADGGGGNGDRGRGE